MFNTLGSTGKTARVPAKEEDRYAFVASYYDPQAELIRQYRILFYPIDNSIEMYDLKTKKIFLKREEYPQITMKDLYLGSIVNVHSRHLKIEEYGDEYTRNKIASRAEITLALIKPDGYSHIGEIISDIYKHEFRINKMKMVHLSRQEAEQFYAVHNGKPFYKELVEFMSSGRIVAMELSRSNAVLEWRDLIGPTNFEVARQERPDSIRGRFASDATRNVVHGSDSQENAKIESDFFFSRKNNFRNVSQFKNSTLGIILPHAIIEENAGKILTHIQKDGFNITALELFVLDKVNAADFLEVYKGVVTEYLGMVEQLCFSPCIAFELIKDENIVEDFRALCGPSDPELARLLRPNTIRAMFGIDKVKNAIHCTDLEEDSCLEVEFFFNILQNSSSF